MAEIRGREDWESLPPDEQERYVAGLEAIGSMRRKGLDLESAARRAGVTPDDVVDVIPSAVLHRGERGDWEATPEDDLYRRMRILSTKGVRKIDVHGSRQAGVVGAYGNAVKRYVDDGSTRQLRKFPSPPFETDPDRVLEWWQKGQLDFLEIYVTDQPGEREQ